MMKTILNICCILAVAQIQSQVIVLGDLAHDYRAAQGGQLRGTINLQNSSDREEDIRIYQKDYFFTADGAITYGAPGTVARSNAGWIRFDPQLMTLVPGEKQAVNYVVQIPSDASVAGSYWSMLMIEGQPEPGAGGRGLNLSTVTRYGIQIAVTVGRDANISLVFTNPGLNEKNGRKLFTVDIENTGGLLARTETWAELYTADGRSLGRFPAGQRRIYPGTSVRAEMDLTEVEVGIYQTIVVTDCGEDNLFGTNLTLEIR